MIARTSLADSQANNLGAVAQLGERMTGSHEVRGSIPLGSTILVANLWRLGDAKRNLS